MGLWDTVKKQLRSVIEWDTADHSVLFELWSENGDEIKDASTLILKPGQGVVFVYEGKIEAVYTEAGKYDLKTDNVPFITTLENYMQAFESSHKVGIYFFWQTEFLNQKWGTTSPIKYQDPVYNFPVGLRAFGNFSFRLADPEPFFVNILGSRPRYLVDEVRTTIGTRLQQPLTDLLAEAGFSYADIDKNRDELGAALTEKLGSEFGRLGFAMTDFRIEATSFDEATNGRIARIADITAEAKAAEMAGMNYREMQQLEAMRDAARNEGGLAGAGVGLGAGMSMGQMFAQGMQPQQQQAAPASGGDDVATRLGKLKGLLDQGLISQDDFDAKKQAILAEL